MYPSSDLQSFTIDESAAISLTGQCLLITGAAGALGSAIALSAAAAGSDLILLDKNERGLNQVYDEIFRATGIEAGLYPLDLAGATVDHYHELAGVIEKEFGKLTGLIHCAAELGQLAPMKYADAAQWQKTFASNVHGPVFLTASLLPLLQQSAPASIVFTVDQKSKAYWTCYTATKSAVTATMKTLADELDADRDEAGQLRVTCNAVLPDKMRSSIRSSAFPGEDPDTVPEAQRHVAGYLYLISQNARDVNGKILDLTSQ